MKTPFFFIFCFWFFFQSCAQQKFEKPPKPGKSKLVDVKPTKKLKKPIYYLSLGDLKQNSDSLYCEKTDNECYIVDGKTTLYSYYLSSGDTPTQISYTCAKGEFLEGKYQGNWLFYDKKGRIIKKENWNKGKLISRKKYNFNQCNMIEEYKLSNIPNTEDYNSIEQFKKDFFIKNGKLRCSNGIIKQMRMSYMNIDSYEFININNGVLTAHEITVKDAPMNIGDSAKLYQYDKEGNLSKITTVEKKQIFIDGTGHFIEYHTPVFMVKSQKYESLVIKAEGEIKNNFKIGDWKYYNKTGELESTKTYFEKDSVDVRFPYCIFNKKE
jgi:hypothetical protein